jgi:lysylphosphatidylglycerol synthetase-like protein (DUF2156 family)
MESNNFQNLWKSIDFDANNRSKQELNLILAKKAKQTINKFLTILVGSLIVSVGLIVWLIITSLNRQTDIAYLTINILLGLIVVFGAWKGLTLWSRLRKSYYNQSIKNWLEERINLITKEFSTEFSRFHYILIPVLYFLTVLSIHVYYENKPFVEVLQTEESIFGLLFGSIIGLLVSFYATRRIRKYHLANLESLKKLYNNLNDE